MPGPVTLNPSIPRNTSGQPVFPSIDLDIVPIADIRLLLSDYFDQCWGMSIFTLQKQILMRMILAERSSSNKSPSIPWEEIISNPGNYYDSERHHFSTKLDHPQNLSAIQVLNLAEGLLSTSVMDSPCPSAFFRWRMQLPTAQPHSPSFHLPLRHLAFLLLFHPVLTLQFRTHHLHDLKYSLHHLLLPTLHCLNRNWLKKGQKQMQNDGSEYYDPMY